MFTAAVLFLLSIRMSAESHRMHSEYPHSYRSDIHSEHNGYGNSRVRETEPQMEELIPITIYYGSLCMDSRKFFMEQITRAYELLGSHLDMKLIPYGKASTRIANDTDYYEFTCQAGPHECYGNKLHACALDLLSDRQQTVMYIACMMDEGNPGRGSNDEAADLCGQTMDVDSEAIKACARDSKGDLLLHYYGEQNSMVRYTSIPYVLVDGQESEEKEFIRDICNAFNNPPTSCEL